MFFSVIWYACFDPVFNTFVNATLQTFFSTGKQAPCAMASVRAVYSAGFATQQAISIALGPGTVHGQALGLLALILFAAACLRHLHKRVCPIDAKAAPAAAGGVEEDKTAAEGGALSAEGVHMAAAGGDRKQGRGGA